MSHGKMVLVFCVSLVVAGAPSALSQVTDGNVVGVVLDPTGASVPGAAVELKNLATGVQRSAMTKRIGSYRFDNVPVGLYRILVRAEGFSTTALDNVSVALNRTSTANISMELGPVTTEIVVDEASALIDTTSQTVGSAFGAREALYSPSADLPLGVLNLSLQAAGVASSGGLGQGDGPSIGGQRPRQNNFTIEGVDNNRKDVTGRSLDVSNEVVAEFSVLQNQYSAEFGHSTGGQFNTVIKSGSNSMHGSLYEYFQNRELNAVDESNARQGIRDNPRFDSNRFGGTVGGPAVKNKLFYFGAFEYNPVGEAAAPVSATMAPTAEAYSLLERMPEVSQTNLGVLQQFAGASPAGSDTTTVAGVDVPIGVLPISFPTYQNNYNWVVSLDYTHSERDQFRFRYIDDASDAVNPNILPNLPVFAQTSDTKAKLATVSAFHAVGSSSFNELRLNYSRFSDGVSAGMFEFPGLDAFPNITIEQDLNLQLGPPPTSPNSVVLNTYQLVDNFTWLAGRHTLKMGIDARKYIAPTNFVDRVRGDYNYSGLERFLLDLSPDVAGQRNVGGIPYDGNQSDFYWYVNDEIKVRRNLTLNLGIRHEYKGVPAGDKLQALNSASSVPGLLTFDRPRAQKANFAPRVGLAYSPGENGTTVIRAGFGMAYDVYFDNFGTLTKPPQLENVFRVDNTTATPDFLANGGIRPEQRPAQIDAATARALTSGFIPDQHLPYSIQWNFGVQRVFADDYTFETRYLGTRGVRLFTQNVLPLRSRVSAERHLPTFLDAPSQAELDALPWTLNDLRGDSFFVPEFAAAGFGPVIFSFPNRGNSIYHGLANELTRRFSNGLQFRAGWTWSHNIDDSTADLFSTLLSPRRPQDFQDMRAERGTSFLDRRHRFTLAWVWETPWMKKDGNWAKRNLMGNWIFSGMYTAESPQFATVQSGTDSNLNLDSAPDRVIVNPAGTDGVGSDVTQLANSDGNVVGYLADSRDARYIKAGPGAWATGGRNTLPLRGINNFDLAVTKRFSWAEGKAIEVRGVFYNALNHPQYIPGSLNTVRLVPSNMTRNNLIPGNALFNDPTRVYPSNARAMHLVVRFTF